MSLAVAAGLALIVALFGGLFIAGIRLVGWRGTVLVYTFTAIGVAMGLVAGFLIEGHL